MTLPHCIWRRIALLAICLTSTCALAADTTEKDKALAALIPYINTAAKSDLQVRIDALDHTQRVKIVSADAQALTAKLNGNDMPTPWKLISNENIAELGKASIRTDAACALAVADFCIATEQKAAAESTLELAVKNDTGKKLEKEIAARRELAAKVGGGAAAADPKKADPKTDTKPDPAKAAFTSEEPHEWPQLGFDAGSTFATPGTLKFPLAEKWRYMKAAPIKNIASTVMAKDRVLVSCVGDQNGDAKQGDPANNPYLVGLDFAKGTKSWAYSPKNDWTFGCYLAVANGSVIYNDDGFGGVDFETGAKTWGGGADSWGVINVDTKAGLIVKSCTMKVDNSGPGFEAVSLSGEHKWNGLQEDGERMKDGMPFCSVCQGAGMAFVTARWSGPTMKHTKGMFALKQTDGTEAWKLDGEWGGVSFDGRNVFSVKKDDGKLYCLNPADGATVWSATVAGPAVHPPAHGRGICVVVTDAGVILAFPTEGKDAGKSLAWQAKTEKPFPPAALTLSGVKMTGNADIALDIHHTYRRTVLAIAAGSGKNGAVVIANGNAIQAYDLKTGGGLWSVPWDEKTFGPAGNPCIANECLVVSGKNGVVCFGSH
jgi:outer membrane protein assembly factor BamB